MKIIKPTIVVALFSIIFSMQLNTLAETRMYSHSIQTTSIIPNDDGMLQLKLFKDSWKIDIHASFSGNEGNSGKLKVYNERKEFIHEFDIELKKAPEYYNVNLNEFSNGTYIFELTTSAGTHTTTLTIK